MIVISLNRLPLRSGDICSAAVDFSLAWGLCLYDVGRWGAAFVGSSNQTLLQDKSALFMSRSADEYYSIQYINVYYTYTDTNLKYRASIHQMYIYICILYGVCIWHPFDILHHFVPRWSSTSSCSKECQDLGWGVVSWISSGGVDTQKPTMSPDSQHNSWLNLTKPHPRGSRGECTLLHILH